VLRSCSTNLAIAISCCFCPAGGSADPRRDFNS
jgi:hypothetical protein